MVWPKGIGVGHGVGADQSMRWLRLRMLSISFWVLIMLPNCGEAYWRRVAMPDPPSPNNWSEKLGVSIRLASCRFFQMEFSSSWTRQMSAGLFIKYWAWPWWARKKAQDKEIKAITFMATKNCHHCENVGDEELCVGKPDTNDGWSFRLSKALKRKVKGSRSKNPD